MMVPVMVEVMVGVMVGVLVVMDDDIYYDYILSCHRIFYPLYTYLLTCLVMVMVMVMVPVDSVDSVAMRSIQLWLFGIQLWK